MKFVWAILLVGVVVFGGILGLSLLLAAAVVSGGANSPSTFFACFGFIANIAIYIAAGYSLSLVAPIPHNDMVVAVLIPVGLVNLFAYAGQEDWNLFQVVGSIAIGFGITYLMGRRYTSEFIERDAHIEPVRISTLLDNDGQNMIVMWIPTTQKVVAVKGDENREIGTAKTLGDAADVYGQYKEFLSASKAKMRG